jgi:alanine racemase
MPYSIEKITQYIEAKRIGENNTTINWLLTDSRSLSFPKHTLFFALKGERDDGHNYVDELYGQGVRNFVVSRLPKTTVPVDANYLIVDHPLRALQQLAKLHRNNNDIPTIGITGSNGKTIIKEWLYQLLHKEYYITRSPRSYNSQIGVPLSVWQINEKTDLAIFEAGISQLGEMEHLQPIIQPNIGVFTNISGAHQENFSSLQQKCMEKMQLFKNCDIIVYNSDNELINNCVAKSLLTSREIAWSQKDTDKPLYIRKIDKRREETTIYYRYLQMDLSYEIPFVDDASIENSIHCLAVCLYLVMQPETIAQRMNQLEPIAMRMEVKEANNNCVLINDSYNSDLASLDIALDFMYRRSKGKKLKRTLIVSDVLQTGQTSNSLYKNIAEYAKSKQVDCVIGIGDKISRWTEYFTMESYFFENTTKFIESRMWESFHNQIILLKGSRSFHFEKIAEVIEMRVHETVLKIDLNAIVANLNYYRNFLNPSIKTICMIKASAYGAGAIEIAKTLQDHKVDYLAVAVADEGSALRKAGITCPIIVMNPELSTFSTMINYQLEPEIYSFHILKALTKEAEKAGANQIPIHIKLDTGMHRLGFKPEEIPALIEKLKLQSSVTPKSIFSHFAGSDSKEFDDYTKKQLKIFKQASDEFQSAFNFPIMRHMCNTAGITRFPEAHFDMVRLGIGLYGIDPIENKTIHNVSILETTILEIKEITSDQTVGYNRKGVLARNSKIAALPIGYADGLDRRLGNTKGYCMIKGQKAPYVGNICMDICMVDVTDIDCKEGDSAIIFGDELPVVTIAKQLETIPYEILTGISTRVKRIYYQE